MYGSDRFAKQVDIITWNDRRKIKHHQLKEMCAILSGLVVCKLSIPERRHYNIQIFNKQTEPNAISFDCRVAWGRLLHVCISLGGLRRSPRLSLGCLFGVCFDLRSFKRSSRIDGTVIRCLTRSLACSPWSSSGQVASDYREGQRMVQDKEFKVRAVCLVAYVRDSQQSRAKSMQAP